MSIKLLLFYISILAICVKSSYAQNRNVNDKFPPNGWKVIDSCLSDFNNDRNIDKAYVIQEIKETIVNEKGCINSEKYYRKELIIKFGIKDGKFIVNHKSSKVFGTCNWGVQGSDAFTGIGKRKNTLIT